MQRGKRRTSKSIETRSRTRRERDEVESRSYGPRRRARHGLETPRPRLAIEVEPNVSLKHRAEAKLRGGKVKRAGELKGATELSSRICDPCCSSWASRPTLDPDPKRRRWLGMRRGADFEGDTVILRPARYTLTRCVLSPDGNSALRSKFS